MNEQFLTIPEPRKMWWEWRNDVDHGHRRAERLKERIRLLEEGDNEGDFRRIRSYCWACLEDAPLKDGLIRTGDGTKRHVGLCQNCYNAYRISETTNKEAP